MKLKDVQSNNKKDIIISIRTTKDKSKWMRDNNVSPSLLFDKALEEIMNQGNEENNELIELGDNLNKM